MWVQWYVYMCMCLCALLLFQLEQTQRLITNNDKTPERQPKIISIAHFCDLFVDFSSDNILMFDHCSIYAIVFFN